MSVTRRGCFVLAVLASAVAAHAELNFSNIDANITFEDNSSFDLNVLQNNHGLDITAGNMPMYVDSVNSDHTSATITVDYDLTSTDGSINELDLMFTGWAMGNGSVSYDETVFDTNNNALDSVNGTMGAGSPFVQSDVLTFDGQKSIHVTKTFTLDLGRQTDGIPVGDGSLATIGLIQQNAVPEPASMAALAMGGLGLLARRRRK